VKRGTRGFAGGLGIVLVIALLGPLPACRRNGERKKTAPAFPESPSAEVAAESARRLAVPPPPPLATSDPKAVTPGRPENVVRASAD
jgi:hypothetical protein